MQIIIPFIIVYIPVCVYARDAKENAKGKKSKTQFVERIVRASGHDV